MCGVLEEFPVLGICSQVEEGVGLASTLVTLFTHNTFSEKKKPSSPYQMSQVPWFK